MSDERADDRALAGRIAAGDEGAFTEVIDALHRPLLRIAESYVGRGGGAEDLVQETWEAVAKHAAEFEGRSSLRTWITRILMNRATTRRSRQKRLVPLEDDPEAAPTGFSSLGFWAGAAPEAPGPEETLLRRESLGWQFPIRRSKESAPTGGTDRAPPAARPARLAPSRLCG